MLLVPHTYWYFADDKSSGTVFYHRFHIIRELKIAEKWVKYDIHQNMFT